MKESQKVRRGSQYVIHGTKFLRELYAQRISKYISEYYYHNTNSYGQNIGNVNDMDLQSYQNLYMK